MNSDQTMYRTWIYFRLWEEAKVSVPRRNPRKHWENMQTPHPVGLNSEPLLTTVPPRCPFFKSISFFIIIFNHTSLTWCHSGNCRCTGSFCPGASHRGTLLTYSGSLQHEWLLGRYWISGTKFFFQQILNHVTIGNVNNVKGRLAYSYESRHVLYWLQ